MQRCDIDNIKSMENLLRSSKIKDLGLKYNVMFSTYTKMYDNEAFTYLVVEPIDDSSGTAYRAALIMKNIISKKLGFPIPAPINNSNNAKTVAIPYTRANLDIIQGKQQVKKSDDFLPDYSNAGKYDYAVEEKYFATGRTQPTSEVLKKIADSGHPLAPVAEQLSDYIVNDFPITLEDEIPDIFYVPNSAGVYLNNSQSIVISKTARFRGRGSEPTIIHEIIHGMTHNSLRTDNEVNDHFNKLYDYALTKLNQDLYYGLTNVDEFIVALFTDSVLIAELQNIKPMTTNKKFKNLFDEVFDYIVGLFGYQSDNNLYGQAFAAATQIIHNDKAQKLERVGEIQDVNFAQKQLVEQANEEYNKAVEEDIIEKDCSSFMAAQGLQSSFETGGTWKIVKDLKGYPSHAKGGVDLTIGKGGVNIKKGNSQFKAEDGLVIPDGEDPPVKKLPGSVNINQFNQPKTLVNTPEINNEVKPTKKFNNIVDKQKYWDTLPKKYGKYVADRQEFIDLYDREMEEKKYSEKYYTYDEPDKSWSPDMIRLKSEIERTTQALNNPKEYLKGYYSEEELKNLSYGDRLDKEISAKIELEDKNKALIEEFLTHKDNNFEVNQPRTSWRKEFESRKDIKNKALLYSSLMEEGGNDYTLDRKSYIDGFESFGLDTIYERSDSLIKAGYLPKDFKSNMKLNRNTNEKLQDVKSANFKNLQDVITAKNAIMNYSTDYVTKQFKDRNIPLSKEARDYFTLVAYNAGEGNVNKMIDDYNKAGILKNNKFLNDDSYSGYRQIHRNAMKRIQTANMLTQEGIIK